VTLLALAAYQLRPRKLIPRKAPQLASDNDLTYSSSFTLSEKPRNAESSESTEIFFVLSERYTRQRTEAHEQDVRRASLEVQKAGMDE
jgi:hypothetical protein